MSLMTFVIAIVSVSLNALAQICLRKAALGLGGGGLGFENALAIGVRLALNPWMAAGIACYAVSILVWIYVLSKVEVSAAYPLLSVGYVIAALVGLFYLGEDVSLARWIGIGLICAGVIFVARSV